MGDLAAYAGMFWSAFVAATILPGASEVLLVALLVGGTAEPWIVVAAATVGNTVGPVANWACGRFDPPPLKWSAQQYGFESLKENGPFQWGRIRCPTVFFSADALAATVLFCL